MNYHSTFTILHPPYKAGLVDNNIIALLTAGPQMLAVTQQTPTSPQGEEETQMSETGFTSLKRTVPSFL